LATYETSRSSRAGIVFIVASLADDGERKTRSFQLQRTTVIAARAVFI